MKWAIGFLLLAIGSCAEIPVRNPAAENRSIIKIGEVDTQNSSAHIFSSHEGEIFQHFIVLNLQDKNKTLIDCEPEDVLVKSLKGVNYPFEIERNVIGKYYLKLKGHEKLTEELKVSIQGKLLKKNLKLESRTADFRATKVKIIKKKSGFSLLQIDLRDAHGKSVELPSPPEIILEGLIEIQDIKHIKDGKWQFTLIYPEQNFIGYISIRAHDTYLKDLFRFHHVEK